MTLKVTSRYDEVSRSSRLKGTLFASLSHNFGRRPFLGTEKKGKFWSSCPYLAVSAEFLVQRSFICFEVTLWDCPVNSKQSRLVDVVTLDRTLEVTLVVTSVIVER